MNASTGNVSKLELKQGIYSVATLTLLVSIFVAAWVLITMMVTWIIIMIQGQLPNKSGIAEFQNFSNVKVCRGEH